MAKAVRQTIGILGAGGIGGMLAALFSRAGHDVVCIGRQTGPLTLESSVFGTFPARAVFSEEFRGALDVLFITVKSPFLVDALLHVKHARVRVAVSLLNGTGHAEIIRRHMRVPVIVGMIGSVEVIREGGVIRHLSQQRPHIHPASRDISTDRVRAIATMLADVGVDSSVLGSEEEVIWKKLVRINALAVCTAAAQKPVGFIRTNPLWRERLEKILQEGAAVAQAAGVAVDWRHELSVVEQLPENLTTSLQRDIAAGKPSELESIIGGVLREAREHGIKVPVLEELYRDIHANI